MSLQQAQRDWDERERQTGVAGSIGEVSAQSPQATVRYPTRARLHAPDL